MNLNPFETKPTKKILLDFLLTHTCEEPFFLIKTGEKGKTKN